MKFISAMAGLLLLLATYCPVLAQQQNSKDSIPTLVTRALLFYLVTDSSSIDPDYNWESRCRFNRDLLQNNFSVPAEVVACEDVGEMRQKLTNYLEEPALADETDQLIISISGFESKAEDLEYWVGIRESLQASGPDNITVILDGIYKDNAILEDSQFDQGNFIVLTEKPSFNLGRPPSLSATDLFFDRLLLKQFAFIAELNNPGSEPIIKNTLNEWTNGLEISGASVNAFVGPERSEGSGSFKNENEYIMNKIEKVGDKASKRSYISSNDETISNIIFDKIFRPEDDLYNGFLMLDTLVEHTSLVGNTFMELYESLKKTLITAGFLKNGHCDCRVRGLKVSVESEREEVQGLVVICPFEKITCESDPVETGRFETSIANEENCECRDDETVRGNAYFRNFIFVLSVNKYIGQSTSMATFPKVKTLYDESVPNGLSCWPGCLPNVNKPAFLTVYCYTFFRKQGNGRPGTIPKASNDIRLTVKEHLAKAGIQLFP